MDESRFESLTRRERDCLRLVDRETATGDIASQLGLSPASVETYLKRAREKLGGASRFVAARGFRQFEERHQSPGPHRSGLSDAAHVTPIPASEREGDETPLAPAFAEERHAFDHFALIDRVWQAEEPPPLTNRMPVLQRLFAIAGLIVVIAFVLLLAFPLSESFQRLANVVDPIKH